MQKWANMGGKEKTKVEEISKTCVTTSYHGKTVEELGMWKREVGSIKELMFYKEATTGYDRDGCGVN